MSLHKALPVLLQSVSPAAEFAQSHAFDLRGWRGNVTDAGFTELANLIFSRLGTQKDIARDTIEVLQDLPLLEAFPLIEEGGGLRDWLAEATPILERFQPLYKTMKWEQNKPQLSSERFVDEVHTLINELPPFPSPGHRGTPSPIHGQGLLEKLREYIGVGDS